MLHDIDFAHDRTPRFFRATMRDGVIEVPPLRRRRCGHDSASVEQSLRAFGTGSHNRHRAVWFQPAADCISRTLNPNGSLHAIDDIRERDGKKPVPRSLVVLGNAKPSGSGINPGFLFDNPAYMLGYKADDEKPERTVNHLWHSAFATWMRGLQSTIRSILAVFVVFSKNGILLKQATISISDPNLDMVSESLASQEPIITFTIGKWSGNGGSSILLLLKQMPIQPSASAWLQVKLARWHDCMSQRSKAYGVRNHRVRRLSHSIWTPSNRTAKSKA